MLTWVKENWLSFFQVYWIKCIIFYMLKITRIPQHVAIIMDGNRRYAKKVKVKTGVGHSKGYGKLTETLKWCLNLGIREITVYAFSIENFKRTKEEVDTLMSLTRDKFKIMLEDIDEINNSGIKINFSGRLSLLPNDIEVLLTKIMLATRDNNKLQANIAFAYTGRDEISRAASRIIDGVKNKELSVDDINEDLVSQTLDVGEPELLIRTSGEVRLSDFMLWQVSNTVLYFSDVLWPEFTIWNFLAAIIYFQRHAPPPLQDKVNNSVQQQFLVNLKNKKWQELELASG